MTLYLVGDEDQMLYSFQGAKNGLFSGGIDKWIPGIETIKLEINYRSHDEIIAKSQKLISHNYSDLGGLYPQEFIKDASGIKGSGGIVQFQMYSDAEQEALEVANTISELLNCPTCHGNGLVDTETGVATTAHNVNCAMDCPDCTTTYTPGDFFIGARTRAQLGYVEGALVRADIPFINIAGGSFWQSRHVADVIGYLRLAHDTSDKAALKRVYNIPSASHQYTWNDARCKKCKGKGHIMAYVVGGAGPAGCPVCNGLGFIEKDAKFQAGDYCPTRYLGEEFLGKIDFDFYKIDKILLGEDGWRYQTKKKDYTKYGPTKAQDLQEFVWMLQHALNQADNVGQVIRVIIDDCYEKYLKAQGMGDDGLSNAKLEDLATVEEIASRYASADKFLTYVDEMVEAAEKAKNKEWGDYVVLSTYHGLKGLERPIVFGLGWSEGKCQKTGKNVGLLPHTFSLSPPPNFGVLPGGGMSPVEDERCIGFVCISRAIERCYLSGIESYRSWTMGPSRFIHEMELI